MQEHWEGSRMKCMEKVSMSWAASTQKVSRNQARGYEAKAANKKTKNYVRKLSRDWGRECAKR